jgi:hypothetical protein
MVVDGRSNLANFAKKQRTRYWQAYLKGGEKVEHVEHPEVTSTNRAIFRMLGYDKTGNY